MIKERPLISVCIIAFNQEEYIEECLRGAVSQKFNGDFEIVIGEDYSTDKTREICREFDRNYPDLIRLIERSENLGMMGNFISTLRSCQGKYIAICEGDDYWTDNFKLQKQFDAMEQNMNVNLSFHQCDILDSNRLPKMQTKEFSKYQDLEIIGLKDVISGNGGLIPMATIFFRRKILKDYFKHVGKYSGGHFLLQVMGSINGALFLKRNMAVYRKNSSTSIIKNVKNSSRNYEFWINNHLEKLKDFKEITGNKYNNLIDSIIKKDKINAFRSFKTSKEFRKELYQDLAKDRNLTYGDRLKYHLIFKNNLIKDMTEEIYRFVNLLSARINK